MATEIQPDLQSFPTRRGYMYTFSGIVRGSIADTTVNEILSHLGFSLVSVYEPRSTTQLPPLGENERYFAASGTWTKTTPVPSALSLPVGAIVIYQMLEVTPIADPALQPVSYLEPVSPVVRDYTFTAGFMFLIAAGLSWLYYRNQR